MTRGTQVANPEPNSTWRRKLLGHRDPAAVAVRRGTSADATILPGGDNVPRRSVVGGSAFPRTVNCRGYFYAAGGDVMASPVITISMPLPPGPEGVLVVPLASTRSWERPSEAR